MCRKKHIYTRTHRHTTSHFDSKYDVRLRFPFYSIHPSHPVSFHIHFTIRTPFFSTHSLTHRIRCVFLGLVPLISIRKLNEPCFHFKQMYICPVNKHNTNTTQPFNRNVRAEFRKNKQKELNFLPIYIHRA